MLKSRQHDFTKFTKMGVDYNHRSDSAYIDGVTKGQYKRWFSWCKCYAGFGALERNPAQLRILYKRTKCVLLLAVFLVVWCYCVKEGR